MNKFDAILLEDYKIYRIQIYKLDSKLDFGKFKDCKLSEILETQPSYINYCLSNVGFFSIGDDEIIKIKNQYSQINLTQDEEEKRINKYKVYLEQTRRFQEKVQESERNHDQFEYELMQNNNEDYYNDNLDMDQQSEDFYTTIDESDLEEPENWNLEYKSKPEILSRLIEYAEDKGAYAISLYGKTNQSQLFIEIYKGRDEEGKLLHLESFDLTPEIKSTQISELYVFLKNKERYVSTLQYPD